MWWSYLTAGLRAMARHKTYAFINIFGLAIGLAACVMIFLYVRHEASYDAWLPDAERVYQAQSIATDPGTGTKQRMQGSPRPTAEALAKDFAEIELASRAEHDLATVLRDGLAEAVELVAADASFFRIIGLRFLHGDPASALADTGGVALSRAEAVSRFGTVDAVGRTLTIVDDGGVKRDLKVTAVFEDLPDDTHLDFTMVRRLVDDGNCGWQCVNGTAYVKLRPGADARAINARLEAWERRNIPSDGSASNARAVTDWELVPVRDVHLSGASGPKPGNDRTTLATFSIVALLILVVAVFNFVNLATARAGQRAREVALRKVVGASRSQLVIQFLAESTLVTAVAMLIALTIVELALPYYSAFVGADIRLAYFGSDGVALPIALLTLGLGLAGGLYPALFLSRFRPSTVLRGSRATTEGKGSGRLRTLLVVLQSAVSIGLIACTVIIHQQTVFQRTFDPGFEREGLLTAEGLRRPDVQPLVETLTREIGRVEGVTAVSGTQIVPGSRQTLYTMVATPGRAEPQKIGWYAVEPGFFDTMKMHIVAGRALGRSRAADRAAIQPGLSDEAWNARAAGIIARGLNIVVNQEAARRLGHRDPTKAVGTTIRLALYGDEFGTTPATIVGVVGDARFRSVREPVEPIIFYDTGRYSRLAIRFTGDPNAARDGVEAAWRRVLPAVPPQIAFADARIAEYYTRDVKRGETFAGFALLAEIVAGLGLFGLAAFAAERRTKEIGIRKVLGARVRDIVRLLAWQFSKPVVLANLIAWPVAWWAMRDWLNTFDARIALTPTPFALAGLLALAIALATVAGQAFRVARLNPIHALRYE